MAQKNIHKVTTSEGNSYTVKVVDEDNSTWAAFFKGETSPSFTFEAPLDSSKDTIAGEIDYLEMTADEVPADDDYDLYV